MTEPYENTIVLGGVREDIYGCNSHNAIKNKAAVPRPTEAFNT